MLVMVHLSKTHKSYQYVWKSAPIDYTDVVRIFAAVGREFRLPLDIELLLTPTLNPDNNHALFKYLRDVSMNSQLAISVLQTLLEESRTAHRKR